MMQDDGYVTAAPFEHLFYRTRDLYEAAAIHSFQKPVINVEREGQVCYFVFGDRQECEKMVSDFRNRNLMVNAKVFVDSLRTMKDFIYNHGEKGSV